ncbi:hypothetical protein F52700_12562 [Fusarium sp. NRRL 52700]|nr:hypothetical protein F52700_12562 [Fusarium sp. NRRL 52700]
MFMLDTFIPSFHPNAIVYLGYKLVPPLTTLYFDFITSLSYLRRIILPHALALPSYLTLRRNCLPIELLRVLFLPHPRRFYPSPPVFINFLLALLCALNTAARLLCCITSSSCCSDPSFVSILILLSSSVVGKGRIRLRRRSDPFVTIITTDIAAAAAIASCIAISVFLPSVYNACPISPFNDHVFRRPSSGFGRWVMENAANRCDDGSVAVEARQEAPELSQNRVAKCSHDNVFARIQSRGANNDHVAGGQPREHNIASLEAEMASYQPVHPVVTVSSNSNLASTGAQFEARAPD